MQHDDFFPALDMLLQTLKGGFKHFGFNDIEDLLAGRGDQEFIKRANKKRWAAVESFIGEVQEKCSDLDHLPDPRQIKFFLWNAIREAIPSPRKTTWDATQIGSEIVSRVKRPGQECLHCWPLFGSFAPKRRSPSLHSLANGVWLLDPAHSASRLKSMLGELLVELPSEVWEQIERVNKQSTYEYGALLHTPLIACHTKGWVAQRDSRLRAFGFPLIALRNLVTINGLDTSKLLDTWDNPSSLAYLLWGGLPAAWPGDLRSEWISLCDPAEVNPNCEVFGLLDVGDWSPLTDGSRQVYSYDFPGGVGQVSVVRSGGEPPYLPPVLVLPSLLDSPVTRKLIDAGERLTEPSSSPLHRKIGHALCMWTNACSCAQDEAIVSGGFREGEEWSKIADPDSLILYSTVVLETLFSSEGEKQEVTTRIADFTAGLLGETPDDRYKLSSKVKKSYALRSAFVHGSPDRPADYTERAMWLFELATLALWETVRLVIVDNSVQDWKKFEELLKRKKFGAS